MGPLCLLKALLVHLLGGRWTLLRALPCDGIDQGLHSSRPT